MGENGGPDVHWRMFENPKAEIGLVEEGDGLAEGRRGLAEGRGDFEVLAFEVDGVVVVHAAEGTKRDSQRAEQLPEGQRRRTLAIRRCARGGSAGGREACAVRWARGGRSVP